MLPHAVKRQVSETTKKIVAANQNWNCAACGKMLSAFYEIDHKVGLWRGGSNDISNLHALHRECHAEKGALERRLALKGPQWSAQCFNELFEYSPGGAFPLPLAHHISLARYGQKFDERSIANLQIEPFMVYPPSWRELFERHGVAFQPEGGVLQEVRLRPQRQGGKLSTRCTQVQVR